LQLIEQPLPPDALLAHADAAARLRTPIALDETITSAAVARDAIALGACDAVVVKPARLGLTDALAVHRVCLESGVPAVIGGMLETGIGRSVLVAVAAMPAFTMTGDCSASARYFGSDNDLTEDFVLDADGCIAVPDAPVHVRPKQLARYTIARERITR
jgi:O-succinylbenzoate synthase